MDEARVEALLSKLIHWGLVEDRDGEIGPTRRWNAKLQASAERINQDVARTGSYPVGNPLILAVGAALREERPTLDDAERDDLVRVLVTLEVSRMTPEKRARYGF